MKRDFTPQFFKRIIIVCPIIIILMCIVQMIYLKHFNSREYVIKGADSASEVYMDIDNRGDSTSVWLKRDFLFKGKKVDLTGETVDCVFYNDSDDLIDNWFMRININGDCYVNNAWCGLVEVHQFVGTENEAVQTLDLRNYSLDDVKLKYEYDGDLLIPLQKGDFIYYYPSQKDNEIPINKKSQLTMGMIFYHVGELDLSDYEINYTFYRYFTQGKLFYPILLLLIFWVIHIMMYYFTLKIYEDAQRELELKKSGISSMSDMYNTIYIVDLVKNEIVSVVAEEVSELKRPENIGADEQLKNLFEIDSTEAFKDLVLEFCDLSTLRDRMGDSNNIACEYISKKRGWCRIRFFAMDYVEGRPVDNVIFTLQVIDNEKKEVEEITHKVARIETERKELNLFFRLASNEIISPLNEVMKINQSVIDEHEDDSVGERIRKSNVETGRVSELLRDVVEYASLESSELSAKKSEYLFRDIVDDIDNEIKPLVEQGRITYTKNISQGISERLYGDKQYIVRCLRTLLRCRLESIDSGEVTFSVFSKKHDGMEHLLFSLKDNGSKDTLESIKLRYRLVDGILKLMGSELHSLSDEENGIENYFEIEQEVRE